MLGQRPDARQLRRRANAKVHAMFARITRYKRKPGTRQEASELLDTMRDEIMALPGMIQFTNMMHSDGMGYLVAIVESEAKSNAHAAKAAAIWARFAQYMETFPVADGYDVVANWSADDKT